MSQSKRIRNAYICNKVLASDRRIERIHDALSGERTREKDEMEPKEVTENKLGRLYSF